METKSTTVRDVFLHLLSIVALYLTSFAFGQLLFSVINLYFPDVLSYSGYEYESLRFSLATIIVVLPFYFFVTRFLVRVRQSENYQDVRIRKWLIYLTLSLAAIAIVSDLVTLLYWLLDGDITIRFVLKVIAVLLIAAVVFYYYFWELNARVLAIRSFVATTLALVGAFVVLGFFVIGSPTQRRAERFDAQRVQDLQNIQNMVVSYWQRKQRLPIRLDDLTDSISGFTAPLDPENQSAYEYREVPLAIMNGISFALCATFTTTGVDRGVTSAAPRAMKPMAAYPYDSSVSNWSHGIGRTCFQKIIDPELYPPITQKPVTETSPRGKVASRPLF